MAFSFRSLISKLSPTLALAALSLGDVNIVHAATITVGFQYAGTLGYSATGSFSYDPATSPSILAESGSGPTQHLTTFSISFFNQAQAPLETGSSVINGISSDNFFRLTYDTVARNITVLDGDIGGSSYQYFLTNLRTPDGKVATPGQTTFNLFYRPNASVALDTAASIQAVPEPSTFLLITGAIGVFATVRRKGF